MEEPTFIVMQFLNRQAGELTAEQRRCVALMREGTQPGMLDSDKPPDT